METFAVFSLGVTALLLFLFLCAAVLVWRGVKRVNTTEKPFSFSVTVQTNENNWLFWSPQDHVLNIGRLEFQYHPVSIEEKFNELYRESDEHTRLAYQDGFDEARRVERESRNPLAATRDDWHDIEFGE